MIKVIKPGFYSTIQDLGRIGYQQFGVPYSGGMDHHATKLANHLLGNNERAAVLEMTMTGATLEFSANTFICISGADMSPKLNETPIKLNKAIGIKKGDVLSFGKLNYGFRSYLAILGGFKTEKVMNSYSMYSGITKQPVLFKNDELLCDSSLNDFVKKHAAIKMDQAHFSSGTIEVFKGPEFDKLSTTQVKALSAMAFTISKDNNRMAYQLEQTIKNNLQPIITSSVIPGTVQLTPSGKLIILMRDCQTTGGYPRILQLKETSINRLAQKFTGQNISFKLI